MSGAGGGGMPPSDLRLCRDAISSLTSADKKGINYLFLEPVNLEYFPTYTEIVARPMDLGTLGSNLEEGIYVDLNAFFDDALLIADNAVRFHAGRTETSFIVGLAKRMAKLIKAERKKAERKAEKLAGSAATVGVGSGGGGNQAQRRGSKKLKLSLGGGRKSTSPDGTSAGSPDVGGSKEEEREKKPKLKLKLGGARKDAAPPASSVTEPAKVEKSDGEVKAAALAERKSAKEKAFAAKKKAAEAEAAALAAAATAEAAATAPKKPLKKKDTEGKKAAKVAVKAKPTKAKPKLKLKLSLGGQGAPTTVGKKVEAEEDTAKLAAPSPAPASAAAPALTTSRGKQLPKGATEGAAKAGRAKSKVTEGSKREKKSGGLKLKLSAPSRGKELPKGVTAPAKEKTPVPAEEPAPAPTAKVAAPPALSKRLNLSLGKRKPPAAAAPAPPPSTISAPPAQPVKSAALKPGKLVQTIPGGGPSFPVAPAPAAVASAPTQAPLSSSAATPFPPVSRPPPVVPLTAAPMTPARRAQCSKVLAGVKRRHPQDAKWFLKPVSDPRLIEDYRAKISSPIDLGTMAAKLDKGQYATLADFVRDLRRIFGNCLRYNTTVKDSFRPVAITMLSTTEDLLAFFITRPESPAVVYPKLVYCWRDCVKALSTLHEMTDSTSGHQTAHYFLHPVSFFCGGEFPHGYLEVVKCPMDLGTVTSKLIEGEYQSVGAFVADCRLVVENCKAFYGSRDDGKTFVELAGHLEGLMQQQLGALWRYDQSPEGSLARTKFLTAPPITIAKPDKEFLSGVIRDLRFSTYTDKFTKETESATLPFEKPVNVVLFPDYTRYVENPMDLETIDRKIDCGLYETPEDFEYDVGLIFRNCEKYNVPKNNAHLVALGKHTAKTFRKLFSARMRGLEGGVARNSISIGLSGNQKSVGKLDKKSQKRAATPTNVDRPSKKPKVDKGGSTKVRILLPTQSSLAQKSAGKKAPRSKSPKNAGGGSGDKKKDAPGSAPSVSNGPVPMHVAIAQVKESYPGRRQYKQLESWEGDCARFFRQLMRHPWISAERPRFIFHVPVHTIFPDIKEAYAAKIANPMDLTTAEAKLLQGKNYRNAQKFVDDIALVFANAVTFNQAGRDEGEPMSCAYYDVARHLLKYARWLSLEILSPFLSDDSDGEPLLVDGPATHWELAKSNRVASRKEMEEIVFREPIEKSEEGDRYTWTEAECEKLLKCLRHQSDLRHMTFFIQDSYPPDYTAYISKPMAWEKCQLNLQRRRYDTIGTVVEDLRLIFSNALKYNERARHTNAISGKAYDAAIHMSKKLEAAIDRMLLSVSDRLGREKIDNVIAQREIEAAERAEEERIRVERERSGSSNLMEVETKVIETVKIVNRRNAHRRQAIDFEFPEYEDDGTHHEQSHYDAIRQAKLLFEKQKKARAAMRATTFAVGIGVFARLEERAKAIAWAEVAAKCAASKESKQEGGERLGHKVSQHFDEISKSNLSTAVAKGDRQQVKIFLSKPKAKKRRRLPPPVFA